MNKWKSSFFIAFLILLVSNAFWLYVTIDAGITYTYQQVTLEGKSNAVEMLGELIVKGSSNYTKKDILHLLRENNKESFIVEEDNLISIKGVKFKFNNGVLFEVSG